jgi:hypothetical protein
MKDRLLVKIAYPNFSVDDKLDPPNLILGVQGRFDGFELAPVQIEARIASAVPHKHIKEVSDTYGLKWWDYKRLSPGHCFNLFAHHYYKSFKIAAKQFLVYKPRQFQDMSQSQMTAIIGMGQLQFTVDTMWERSQGHITGMWKAMMVCDALGIPYDHYSRLAFVIAKERAWKRLPLPNQLYGDDLAARILIEWDLMKDNRLLVAKHPLYDVENYAGLQVQDEYRQWLIANLKKKPDPVSHLASVIYMNPQLPLGLAEPEFPAALLTRARLLAA